MYLYIYMGILNSPHQMFVQVGNIWQCQSEGKCWSESPPKGLQARKGLVGFHQDLQMSSLPPNKSSMCIISSHLRSYYYKCVSKVLIWNALFFGVNQWSHVELCHYDLTKTHEEIRRESPNRPDNCDSVTMGFPIAYLRVTLQIAPSVTGCLLPRPRSKSKEVRSSVWEFPPDFFLSTKFGPWSVPSWSLRCNPKMAP